LSPPPERRRIVLDEDINWKLAQELIRRGRPDATAVRLLGLNEKKDAALFKALAQGDYEPFVLVTYDNKMPVIHAAEIAHHGTTIAVVGEDAFKASRRPASEQEAYIRDVVHRWLHRIEQQAAGMARIYSPHGSRSG
jgi:predicted nuclease of predicted toxin-antitoxin system